MLTPLKTDSCNPLCASPLLPLPCMCVEQGEAKRLSGEQISELQVEIDGPHTLLEDERHELRRKVRGLPID